MKDAPFGGRNGLLIAIAISSVIVFSPLCQSFSANDLPDLSGHPVADSKPPAPAAPSHPLTLAQATSIALSSNPQTREAWAKFRGAAAALGIARAAYWPQVSATFSVTHAGGPSGKGSTIYSPGLSVSYLLWDFGQRSGTAKADRYAKLSSRLAWQQSAQDVMLSVEQAYYAVQGDKALIDADNKSVASARESLHSAELLRKHGVATIGAVYQARTALSQARLKLRQDQGALASDRGSLAVAMNRPPDAHFSLVPLEKKTPDMPRLSASRLLSMAKRLRPSLLAAKATEMAAFARIRSTRSQGLPSIRLSGSTSKTWGNGIGASSGGLNYSLGATISIPLFAGGGDRAALEQARAQATQSAAARDMLARQIELVVWEAYQRVVTDKATLTNSDAVLNNARHAEQVAMARYRHGLDTMVTLLSAQSSLADARAQKVRARISLFSDISALAHAVGGLSGENP